MANHNNQRDRQSLFNAIYNAGFDIGEYEDFNRRMDNADDRRKFYDAVSNAGYDIGDFDEFERRMIGEAPATNAAAVNTGTKPATQPQGTGQKQGVFGRLRDIVANGVQSVMPKKTVKQPTGVPSFHGVSDLAKGVNRKLEQPERPLPALDPNFKPSLNAPTTRQVMEGLGLKTKTPKMSELKVGKPVVNYDENGNQFIEWQEPEKGNDSEGKLFDLGQNMRERGENAIERGMENAVGDRETQLDRMIGDIERQIKDYDKTASPITSQYMKQASGDYTAYKDDPRKKELVMVLRDLQEARTQLRRRKQLHESSDELGGIGHPFTAQGRADWLNNWKNFGYAVWDTMSDVNYYTSGLPNVDKAIVYRRMKDKTERGEELNQFETELATAGVLRAAIEQESDLPHGYRAGVTTAEMLPFMIQMAINPGGGIGKGLAESMLRTFGRNGFKAIAARYTGRVAGNLLESAILTNTVQAPATLMNAVERNRGELVQRPDGSFAFEGGENPLVAGYKAEASSIIENFTELGMGGKFGGWLGKSLKKAGGTKAGQKMGLGYVNDMVEKIGSTDFAKGFQKFADKTHWNGLIEEPMEEEESIIFNSFLTGDNKISDLWDKEQQADIFAGTMWFGGFMSGMNTAAYPFAKQRMAKRLDEADTYGVATFGEDEWAVHKGAIENMDDKELPKFLYSLKDDDSFSKEQKAALFGYASRLKQWQGANVADMLVRMEGNLSKDESLVHGAYERGRELGTEEGLQGDAANEAKRMLDYERERLSEIATDDMITALDVDPVGTLDFIQKNEDWTAEEKQAAMDYVNAKVTYDGMIGQVRDDIDSRVKANDAVIDSRVNRNDGMIHPATMKDSDAPAYIVSGNVVMTDDGTSVNREKSDKDIIVMNTETGKVEFQSIDDVMSVDEALNPDELKAESDAAIREEYAQKASESIDGVLPFNEGDEYEVMDNNGAQRTISVVPLPADGSVVLDEHEVLVSIDGTEPVVLSKGYVQELADNMKNAELLQKVEGEKNADMNAIAQDEEGATAYRLNDEVALRTEDGVVNGTIVGEEDADGNITVQVDKPVNGASVFTISRESLDGMNDGLLKKQEEEENAATMSQQSGQEEEVKSEDDVMVERLLGRDEKSANGFINNNLEAIEKELNKAKKKKSKSTDWDEYERETAEFDAEVQKWEAEKAKWEAIQKRVREQRSTERAAQQAALTEQAAIDEQRRQAEELRKREEQEALGTNNVAPQIKEKWDAAPKIEGARNEIVLANGERVSGRYVLVESGAATPSHNPMAEFAKNEGFPMDENAQSVNDRDYERDQDAQTITRQIASQYDQRALQTPVVVSNDGVVLSGNGRTMAGELAAQDGTDGAYVDYLKKYPEQFGFTTEQVEDMNHPRVLFVPDEAMPYTADTFAKFNQQEMKGQSKSEQAVKLGKIVDNETFGRIIRSINAFDTLGDFYADTKAASQAINELRNAGAISQAQYAEMFDGDAISAQGKEMLENMLIGKAFESNPDAVRQNTAFKSVRQSVITALAEISNNLVLGEDYSLESELAQAIDLVYNARNNGYKVGDAVSMYARQGNLFQFDEGSTVADYNNATVMMLADVMNDSRVTRLKKWLTLYNQSAQESANGQLDIFSGGVKTQQDIINDVKQILNYGTEEEQQAAIDNAVEQRKAESVQQNGSGSNGNEGNNVKQSEQLKPTDLRDAVKPDSAELGADEAKAKASASFGKIYNQFKGKAKAAIDFLLKRKEGKAVGALHHKDVGDIDIWYGDDKAGLKKIAQKHPEVLDDLQGIIDGMQVKESSDNRIILESDTHRALISKDWYGKKADNWLLSAYEKKDISGGSIDIVPEPEGKQNGTAPLQNELSEGKGTRKSNTKQEKEEKFFNIDDIEELKDAPIYVRHTIEDDAVSAYNNALLEVPPFQFGVPEEQQKRMTYEAFEEKFKDAVGNTLFKGSQPYLNAVYDYITQKLDEFRKKYREENKLEAIAVAEQETDTNPTEAQKEAGNYKKGHLKLDGYDISIENPKGSVRRGTDASGKKWEQKMNNTYGYIRGTEGVDGDHIDVFLSDDPTQGDVFVADQVNKDGSFDEHKVMYGFPDMESARQAYLSNYEEGWQGLGAITPVSKEEFKKWVDSSHRKTKPFAEYSSVKTLGDVQVGEGSNETAGEELEKTSQGYHVGDQFDIIDDTGRDTQCRIVDIDDDGNLKLYIGWHGNNRNVTVSPSTLDLFRERKVDDNTRKELKSFIENAVDDDDVTFLNKIANYELAELYRLYVEWEMLENNPESGNAQEAFDKLDDYIDTLRKEYPVEKQEKKVEKAATVTQQSGQVKEPKRLVSDARMEELKERLRKKMLGQLNMGVDPEILALGAELAVGHIERGLTKFAAYAKAMIEDLGDAIRPYLKSFYNAVRDMPEAESYVDQMDGYDDVRVFDLANFDKNVVDAMATAEEVVAEQEAERHAKEAKGKIVKAKSKKKGKNVKPSLAMMGDLFGGESATEAQQMEPAKPKLDKKDYRTYMTKEAKEYFAKDPRFAKSKHKELNYITAAVWDGVVIPIEELKKIPELVAAQKRNDTLSAQPPLQLSEEEMDRYARRLLDAEHGSAVFEDGKIRKVDGHDDFSGAVEQKRKAYVVIGRPAGGKSSVFANSLSYENKARIVDSDVVKEWLDGFDGGFGAGYVQDMSAKIAERALDIAVQNGDNIVLPRIGGKSVMIMSAALRAMGYDVQLYLNDVVPSTSYMRSSSRFAMTGRYLSLDYLTSIKGKPNETFIKFAKKSIGDYINECTEEEIQKLRDRLESMVGRQRGDLLRALYGWLDAARRGNADGGVRADVERPNTDGTSTRIDLDAPMFSYAEWKSNDVAFGEKPKEIWNSESGKELPKNTNKDDSSSAKANRQGSGRVSSGEPDDSTPAVAKRVDGDLPQRRTVGQGNSGTQEGRGNGREQEVRESAGRQGGGVQQLDQSSRENREEPVTNPKNLRNNHAERGKDYAPKGVDARIEANIKAIELMQQLIESGEQATPEQMAVLRKFSGWGGLGKAFESFTAYTNGKPTPMYLKDLLGDEAYQQAVMSRNSAYYTPANVIDAMWDIARAMGFKGGKVLEGSAGIGNILGLMPKDMSERSDIQAVEIDPTTGNILSLLYPDAQVGIQGFEATPVENGSVDLAITNVPFVTGLRVIDTTGDKDLSKKFHDIHDFCIAKNVRKLKDGGIGIFITSSGTLDNSAKLREWIVNEGGADVVGAFRLNNETFGGTGATSDIIVIRKRVNGQKSPYAIDVLTTTGERTAEYDTGETKRVKGEDVPVVKELSMDYNKYLVEHPENMGGEMFFGFEKGDTFRPTSKALYPVKEKNQTEMLDEWTKSFEGKDWGEAATVSQQTEQSNVYVDLGNDVKEGSMVVSDGKLCVAQRGKAVPLAVNDNKVKGHTKVECFNAYKGIKDALADVLDYQTSHEDNEGLEPLLKKLNKAYDDFVKTYGHLHKNTAISFLKNDVDFSNILALEKFSEKGDVKTGKRIQEFGKTDVFNQRVVEKDKEPEPKNVQDAIIASLYLHGRIDLPWIAATLSQHSEQQMTEEEIKDEIVKDGLGFENPLTRQMEVSYEYLSGNVREKLRQAIENNTDGRYDANIKELEKKVPMNIPAHLIDFSLGSSWIDPKLYEEYVKEKTDVDVTFTPVGGTWYMKAPSWVNEQKNRAMGVVSEMLHKTIMGTQLIEAAIQNKTITVSETRKKWDGSTETITDKEATQACANKIDEIRQDFKEWARAKMQSDPVMSERMERVYNEMFNNYVPKAIPDEFIPEYFSGATHSIILNPHQSKAAVRGTTQPLLLAHEVGSGKTFTLITTAMEMRRLGTAKKPMIVVQNATVGQFVEEAKHLYPNAKILTIEEADRTPEGRKNFYAKIKYNDWDMIVVPQSVLERIPDSEERQMKFVHDKIEEKLLVLEQMKDADPNGQSMIVRQAEKEIEKLEDELASLSSSIVEKRKERDEKKAAVTRQNAEVKAMEMLDRETDDVENFDDMGIDALLVDEAHEYKHLGFATAMQRGVKGIDPSYSKKAQGVFLKTQAVLEKNNGKNVIFATGTPISNTAAEIWTFMRYLMPADVMKEYGIYYFDDFVRNFGNLTQMLEFATSGKFKENNRFAGYVNLPELARIWSGVADIVLNKDVEELRKSKGEESKIPDMEGGQAQDIYLPQTKALRSVMKYVKRELDRYDKMSGKEKKENSHIPLTMYGIAKAAAVDARLVVDDAADEPQSKTNEAVRQTLKSLEETKSYKGTVALFADNYQNKHSGFNLYEDIRKKLIEAGVPAEQIVIIKSGMSVKKKLEIFDAVNRGDIRVIMGSTFTLGTGVNIQERLHTLIHLDAPNRPMDYTQRNGRILRQGNIHKQMNKPVRVLRFGVEDSLDVTAYQRLKTKGAIADSIMNGKKMMENSMENRALEEEEDVFGDTVAQLSGSEYAMLKNQAEKDVRKYEAKKKQYEADQTYCHNEIPRLEAEIKNLNTRIEEDKKALDRVEGLKGQTITVGKQKFDSVDAMSDFIKDYNKKIKETEMELRENPSTDAKRRQLTVNIDGIDFVFTTEQAVETKNEQGTLFTAVRRKMTYSCEALGLEDVPVKQSLLREGLEDIMQNVITGKDFREDEERAATVLQNRERSLEQVKERFGKPFEFTDELKKAHERYDEYAELMKKEMEEKEKKYAEMDEDVDEAAGVVDAEEADEEEEEDTNRYRMVDEVDDVNERFNDELDEQIKGVLPAGHVYDLGMPSDVLLSVGIPNLPIELSAERLQKKSEQENHPFSIEDVKDLPKAIQNPIAVFDSRTKQGSKVILTELQHDGNNFVVVMRVRTSDDAQEVEVNDIRSLYPKDRVNGVVEWVNEGLLRYADKEKLIGFLTQSTNLIGGKETDRNPLAENQEFVSAAKVINSFENPKLSDEKIADNGVRYSIREKDAPVNTGIGYKVFVLKDGKLYPPMVANPNGEATPTGVWLDADAAPVVGTTKTGRKQVKAGGKGTQGGSGTLAYRPGWHLGTIPYASQFNRVDTETGEKELFPANFVWAEVEYADDVDYQDEAMRQGVNANGKFQHALAGLPRVPKDGSYTYRTNPDPKTDPWIITGAMKVNRLLTPSEVDKMVREAGREPQKRQKGAVTDAQIEELNKDIERRASNESSAVADRARELGNKLGVRVRVVKNVRDLKSDNAEKQRRMHRSKGWYDTSTGEVVIVVPNNNNVGDVEATVLHEIVAHKGLRELFGKDFDTFLDNVFNNVEKPIREKIVALAAKNQWDFREATEEYLAGLAENTDFDSKANRSLWQKVKNFFMDMLRKVGISLAKPLTDNELRYILWRSYNRLENNGAFGVAEDVVMQNKLGVGDYSTLTQAGSGELRHRDGDEKAIARYTYEHMVTSAANQFTEAVQDSMLSLKNLYMAILGAEGDKVSIEEVKGYENAYLAENRMHSASEAQVKAWHNAFMKPLIAEMYKLTNNDPVERRMLADYMMAKHGLERNEVMAERDFKRYQEENPKGTKTFSSFRSRDYAGLTALTGENRVVDAEGMAAQMVEEYERTHDTTELWKRVNAATKSSLEKTYRSGMLDRERYEQIRDMFKYYIPLQGFDEKVASDLYAYFGNDGTRSYGTPIRGARGRKSLADDPIATIEMNGEAAIRQGNRNLMKQNFLNFVLNHPSDLVSVSDVWLRYNDATDEWEQYFDADLREDDSPDEIERKMREFEDRMEQLAENDPDHYRRGTEYPNIPYRVLDKNQRQQHQVLVRRNGKDYVLTINGNPRAAQALNGLTNPDVFTEGVFGKAMNIGQQLNRQLSLLYTTRNPEFVLSNYLRDAIYSNSMVWVKESPQYAIRFHKNFGLMNPVFLGKMFTEWESGELAQKVAAMPKTGTLSEMDRLRKMFLEFMENGGETGWTNLRDIEKHKRDLEKELKQEGNTSRKAWKALSGCFDLMNRAVENNARFAAYVTSREMGRSVERSIWDAKEISVNFNKKGSGDKFLTATGQTRLGKLGSVLGGLGRGLYVFWNASTQGLNNIAKASKRHPFKAASVILAGQFMMGVLMPLVSDLLCNMVDGGDGDDDDNKDSYYNLPEYIRRSNICFRWTREMPWITIPLPIEFRAVYGLGELATGTLTGKERYTGEEFAKQFVSQLSQVLPLDFMEGGGGWHAFVPSSVKPMVEAMDNKSWSGLPIYRDNKYTPYKPQWTRAYASANQYIVEATKWLNDVTGGDEVAQGWIDWNPAAIEYMLEGYLGGLFTVYDRLQKTAQIMFGDREFDWRDVLFASRVLKHGDERTQARKVKNEYFDLKEEYEKTKSRLNGYKKIADSGREDALAYAERIDFLHNSKEYLHYEIMDYYTRILDAYSKLGKDAEGEEKKRIEAEENAVRDECVELIHAIDAGKDIDVDAAIESMLERMLDSEDEKISRAAENGLKRFDKRDVEEEEE